MNRTFWKDHFLKILIPLLAAVIFYRAGGEFYQIAWGTGTWRGEFSRTWAILYYLFAVFCIAGFSITTLLVWKPKLFDGITERIIAARQRLGNFRWLLWIIIFIAPVWFFQYTSWGLVFQKLHIRIIIWVAVVCLLTILASKRDQLAGWNEFLASLILTASAFSIAASLKYVSGYPFSYGWSEGNRLWDYSVMFGRDRYIYPADKGIPVLLDYGRRLIGGLVFIIPGADITAARLWVGLTLILPYLILGFVLFRAEAKHKVTWLLLVLWTFLFLKQGPIHQPLVLSAAMVALAWRAPLWAAIPLVASAGYFAEASRFTWIFSAGVWIVMLEFSSALLADRKPSLIAWKRSIILGVFGIVGGFVLPGLIDSASLLWNKPTTAQVAPLPTEMAQAPVEATQTPELANTSTPSQAAPKTFVGRVIQVITIQPLLWYRLLPNSTYNNGILLALLLAVLPLLMVLFHLSMKKVWDMNRLQKLALILPSLAFLGVGLVASAKIGGGGDLHNMDMFLIGLLFSGAVAWQNGGREWVQDGGRVSPFMKAVIVALLVNSSISPLVEMRSFSLGEEASWLKTLTDAKSEATMEMLPTQVEIDSAIQTIQAAADAAKPQGEVLFMDQRQLLTFGYIKDIPLVPEYEKKVLMNQALSGDKVYFDRLYQNLASRRYSLIVSEPLRTPIQDSSYQFGEENNAWVKWVAGPILCYYEPVETIKSVRVQLLVPKEGTVDCSAELP